MGLLAFTQATYPRYVPAAHHRLITEKLEAVERGEITRLMLFCPPRHGKSELASVRFPAWFLGRNPDKRLICTSYGANLIYKFSRRVRNLLGTDAYRALYPGVEVAADAAAVQFWALANHEGQYQAAGRGGGVTGVGADVIVIDDPIKDAKEALSPVVRDAAYEWYVSTLYPRLDDAQGAIVLLMTRWHDDDLAGRLLKEQAEGGDQWHVVRLPAMAEAGDPLGREEGAALWPARFDVDRLATLRRTLRVGWWSAEYQQAPPPELGGRYFQSFSPTKEGQPWHVWPLAFARERYGLAAEAPFPPREWVRWAAVDFGLSDPWCTLFFARGPDRRLFVYRELYGSGVLPTRQAQLIRGHCARIGAYRMTAEDHGDEVLTLVMADPSGWNLRSSADPGKAGVSDVHRYAQAGVPLVKAYNRREAGWHRLAEVLEPLDDGYPQLVLLDGAAPHLQEQLPRLLKDEHHHEDVAEGQEDHAADACRYGVNPATAPEVNTARQEIVSAEGRPGEQLDRVALPIGGTGVQSEW